MKMQIRVKLALMMFLQYAVWGAWMPILSATLINRGIPPIWVGGVYTALWLGCMITPFIGGQLVDRFMPSQIFLAIAHLLAAGAAFVMSLQTTPQMLFVWMLIWALLFAPTLGITNSMAFQHLSSQPESSDPNERLRYNQMWRIAWIAWGSIALVGVVVADFLRQNTFNFTLFSVALGTLLMLLLLGCLILGDLRREPNLERSFSVIRTAGTMGWIVAAFLLLIYGNLAHVDPKSIKGPIPELVLTSLLGVVMAIYSLFLPNTPPSKERADPLAFREAFSLFQRVPGFAVFMIISFFAATEFQFFYGLSGQFLESKDIPHLLVPVTKSISQVAEIVALGILLPLWLPKKGMRWCLLLGSFAWPLRYFIFAIGSPIGLVVASLALHGFGYAFVLVVQQLYVDRVAPKDIRASAQSLLTFVTLGLGNVLGSYFSGWVQQQFTVNGHTNWLPVFILPTVTTLLCAFAYMMTFREPQNTAVANAEVETPVQV